MTVFLRKEPNWFYPQIIFNDNDLNDYVVGYTGIEDDIETWFKLGLNQSTLAAGYDESVENVIIARMPR